MHADRLIRTLSVSALVAVISVGLSALTGCAVGEPLAGGAAYDYNQPVQQGRFEPVHALDGSTRLQWKPLEDQPLTGQYGNVTQPGAFRNAEGSSR